MENNTIDLDDYTYFAGPLNLNRVARRADTVMGTELALEGKDFEMLDLLAVNEDNPLTFEEIYEAVWATPDGTDQSETAQVALGELIDKVGIAGEGFMWIDYKSGEGYVFRTNWGHNWQGRPQIEETFILPEGRMTLPIRPQKRPKRQIIALMSGIGAAVAAVVLVFTAVLNEIEPATTFIMEEQVPLALPDFPNNSAFFHIDNVASPDHSEVTMELLNPEGNDSWFIFEIKLVYTQEQVFASDLVAPGERISNITLDGTLPNGDHEAILKIRAFRFDHNELVEFDGMKLGFMITINSG